MYVFTYHVNDAVEGDAEDHGERLGGVPGGPDGGVVVGHEIAGETVLLLVPRCHHHCGRRRRKRR